MQSGKRARLRRHLTPICRVALLGVVLLGAANGAFAQEPGPSQDSALTVGSRIRVTSSLVQSRVRGVVESVEHGVVTLRPDGGGPIKLSLASITRMDVSLGRRRSVIQGLAAGVLAGLLISLAMPVDPNACGPGEENFCSRGEAIIGATLGTGAIGAVVGTFIKRERWTRITIAPPVPAAAGTARLAVAMRF